MLLKFLRDQIWQFIGAFLGLIAIFITIYFFFLSQQVKTLEVVILAKTQLSDIERSIEESNINSQQTGINYALITVKLEHTGNHSILEDDIKRPVSFVFPEQINVIQAKVTDSVPANIGITTTWKDNIVTLSKVLFNAGDRVIIEIVVSNLPENKEAIPFFVDARIADVGNIPVVSAIEEDAPSYLQQAKIWSLLAIAIALLGLLIAAVSFRKNIKTLQIKILISKPLAELEQGGIQNIDMLHHGKRITDLFLILAEVENNGRRPIHPNDFIRPITFVFPNESNVFEAMLTETSPPNIGASLQLVNKNIIKLDPVLLNPKDKIIIRAMVDNIPSDRITKPVNVDVRIVGLYEVNVQL